MLKLFRYFKKIEWLLICVCVVLVVGQVWLELKMPEYMTEITVLIQSTDSAMKDILTAGGKMIACAVGSLLTAVIVAILSSIISSNFSFNLRHKIFAKVQSFSMAEMGKFSTASLITRSTNDITQVQNTIVMGLHVIIKAPLTAVWAIIKIKNHAWQWTFSTGIAVACLVLVVGVCMALAIPKFKKLQELTDDVNRVTRENLNGIRVVRAYNAEQYQENKFEKANTRLTRTHLFTSRVMSFLSPSITLINSGLTLAIYWLGASIINSAESVQKAVVLANMVTFSQYAIQIVMSFMMLIIICVILPRAIVAAKRINEVLDTPLSIVDGNGESVSNCMGEIEFRNVSFSYPDAEEEVLSDINFVAKKGETIAIIGSTGCGKSTIINLIPRFYDATKGEVFVDGINVKDYKQSELHNKISFVSQKAILFSGNIYDNVAFGDNGEQTYGDEQVKNALKIAQASEFVDSLEEKEKSFVARDGSNFSGGQKQRISIARAICRNSEIIIFDDSFSALDYKTDKLLRESLKKNCKDAIKIIVAQRIGTIRDADKIIVLEDGKIVGMGKHKDLIKDCDVYKEIALSQLSKEEL